jgi:glutamyl-tRNA reductase
MQGSNLKDISNFFIAGINYKKTDAAIRGQYAISNEQYASLLSIAPAYGIHEVFILSTCNRTEIYGFAEDVTHMVKLLCSQTAGDMETFNRLAYVKKGKEAIEHLFNVGAGLDSQILGDYEIVGQIKQSVKFARQHNFIGAYSERLVNAVLQSSKFIKNKTALSGGTVSVSFAAVQYIKQSLRDYSNKKILLLGVGKIGRSTCKNLVDYLENRNITLINRTVEKAEALAGELGLQYAPLGEMAKHIRLADIIIVATNDCHPTVLKSHLADSGEKLIIDLSIPYNVEPSARELTGITLVNVDELSKMKDETVKKRQAEVPKAKAIIDLHIREFQEWNEMRKHVPVLKAVKTKLQQITFSTSAVPGYTPAIETTSVDHNEKIQKVINLMALKLRQQNHRGCHYIEAINDFMAGAN